MEEKETSFMEKLLEETYRGLNFSWFNDYYKTSSYIQERKASHPGGENIRLIYFLQSSFKATL